MRILLIGCEVIIRELCDAVARSPHVVDARFLSKGLHDRAHVIAQASRPPSMRPRLTPGNMGGVPELLKSDGAPKFRRS